jgi:hypothetical protein
MGRLIMFFGQIIDTQTKIAIFLKQNDLSTFENIILDFFQVCFESDRTGSETDRPKML